MPIVRRAQRTVSSTPLPGVRKSAAETPESMGAGVAQAQGDVARAVGDMGRLVANVGLQKYAEIQAEARQRADDVVYLTEDRKLGDWENVTLHDPVHGVLATVTGKDALGLRESVTAEYDKQVSTGEMRLLPRQRAVFLRQSAARRDSIQRAIELYTGEQMQQYERSETEAALTTTVQTAVANVSGDPTRIAEALARADQIAGTYAATRHLGPVASAEVRTKARTAIHEGVIETLVSQGEDRKAELYFEDFKPQIAGDRLASVQRQVESASTAGAGLRAAEAIWTAHGPKTDADPIQLDRMEAAARAQAGDDTKVLDATLKYLRERKGAVDAARLDRKEAVAGSLWKAVAEGASLDQIRRLPEYAVAPGPLQVQVSEHVTSQAEHRADRSYALSERADLATRRQEAQKEQGGWSRYWELSRPATLMGMTENQILGLMPTLGVDHVNRLLKDRRDYATSETKVREATIDAELFNTLADSAGLHPYQPGLQEPAKAQLGRLENSVKSAIDVEQRARNRGLTRDEKATVMQRLIDRRVMIDVWGSDVSRPTAMVVNPSDRTNAYVPFDQIPEPALAQWVNVIRSEFPREQTAARADIQQRYRDRIQRAHAAALLGLGADEERRRLLGGR